MGTGHNAVHIAVLMNNVAALISVSVHGEVYGTIAYRALDLVDRINLDRERGGESIYTSERYATARNAWGLGRKNSS